MPCDHAAAPTTPGCAHEMETVALPVLCPPSLGMPDGEYGGPMPVLDCDRDARSRVRPALLGVRCRKCGLEIPDNSNTPHEALPTEAPRV